MYNEEALSYGSINRSNDRDTFFQDVKQLESLVKDSLLVYIAYELKALDAAQYLADPTLSFPILEKEATLRGMAVVDLAKLVLDKAKAYKNAVRSGELLRTEFNIIYPTLSTYEARVELRDRLLNEFRDATRGLFD